MSDVVVTNLRSLIKCEVCSLWDEDQWHRYVEFEKKQEVKGNRKRELKVAILAKKGTVLAPFLCVCSILPQIQSLVFWPPSFQHCWPQLLHQNWWQVLPSVGLVEAIPNPAPNQTVLSAEITRLYGFICD